MNSTKLLTLLALICLPAAVQAQRVSVHQGGVARWAEPEAQACGFLGKRYPAVEGVCYYPVDFQAKPGIHEIALYDAQGHQHLGSLRVLDADFPRVEIELEDDRLVLLQGEDRERHGEERAQVMKALAVSAETPDFALPLAAPVSSIPPSEDDFGSERIFNGKARSHHTGRDAPVSAGTPLKAIADGTVILAADHLLTGKAVYVDHGGGLVSMLFHLSELAVADGDAVKQGQLLGKVGSTGRSTGPHMHLGLRWLNQRIDPYVLLEDPELLPAVEDSRAEAADKIAQAQAREPAEN